MVQDSLIGGPAWQAPRELPPGYLMGSDIIEESIATLDVISDACSFARDYSEQQLPERWPRLIFEDRAFPGFILDSPELREAIRQAARLGLIDDTRPKEAESSSDRSNVLRIIKKVSPILRGYIEHVQTVPFSDAPQVTMYLAVSGLSDLLDRDHHGVGWHYHYCDRDGRRSDTMLSFDTNQPPRTEQERQVPLKDNAPLFWERHSEANKKFDARPEDWGKKKRSSIFRAAQPELTKRKPYDFRRPAAVAQPVWPDGATLSPPQTTMSRSTR